jgi:uncharacterized membrane protein YhhN
MAAVIILACACALWSVFYIWTEYHWEQRKFFYTKAVNSLIFVAVGVAGFMLLKIPAGYALPIIAALIMGLVGDLFLVFSDSVKSFIIGLFAFLVGQIIYGATFLSFGGFMWYDLIVYAAVAGLCLTVYKNSSLELGKMKIPVLFYMLIIAFMYTMAVSLIYKGGFNTVTTVLIAAGANLFLASDAVLAFARFKKEPHPALRGINLGLYYAAQVLLALSIAFFA